MPYINSTTTVKISDAKKEVIKAKLGQIIAEIPGKSEQWLMVGFREETSLYFRGEKKDHAAFIEVKIFGAAKREHKEAVTSAICKLFEEELDISKQDTYITFEEVKDWGWNGDLF